MAASTGVDQFILGFWCVTCCAMSWHSSHIFIRLILTSCVETDNCISETHESITLTRNTSNS